MPRHTRRLVKFIQRKCKGNPKCSVYPNIGNGGVLRAFKAKTRPAEAERVLNEK
jgi:hypothetical protein